MTSGATSGLLLVHAHPDDESITTGVTMAACAEQGIPVTLVTCTRGEEGEIIPAGLAALAADRQDALGPHRAAELAAAMAELGVTDHRFLGDDGGEGDGEGAGGGTRGEAVGAAGPGWRDSGMLGAPQNDRPAAFWQADPDEAAEALARVIREVRPGTLITYDSGGGYGHPDHVQAHRVATRAAERAQLPGPDGELGHRVARILWNCVPRSAADAALGRLRAAGPGRFPGVAELTDIPGVLADSEVDYAVPGTAGQIAAKAAAMRAHVTQIEVEEHGGPDGTAVFALSNRLVQPLWSTEYYRLAAGDPFPPGEAGPFREAARTGAGTDQEDPR